MTESMHKPEEMRAFFAARVEGYDAHMLTNVEGAREAYARVAELLPGGARTLLDLGCGTGLELDSIFRRFPTLSVTGIDLTDAMLGALRAKFPGKALTLVCGDYFDVDFGDARFDAALSFQTLHHFSRDEKVGLYRRVWRALKPGGVYVEADYTASSQSEEDALIAKRAELMKSSGVTGKYAHVDIPFTVENQLRILKESGFVGERMDQKWGNTAVLVAMKGR